MFFRSMDLEEFVQIVDDMACQHDYPGYELRSLNMGLPESVTGSPAKMFRKALKHEKVLVKLAALRWFWERPGMISPYLRNIGDCVVDADEWVRMEGIRVLSRHKKLDDELAVRIAQCIKDESVAVRRAAASACGKLTSKNEQLIALLKEGVTDSDSEVRGKSAKALRKLGVFAST